MKRNLLLFLLSVCFFLPDFAATGQYNFIRVDGESGLSNSHVKSIIQDSYGLSGWVPAMDLTVMTECR